jgi:hypothetical protein
MTGKIRFLFLMVYITSHTIFGQDKIIINRSLEDFASEMRFVGSTPGRSYTKFEGSEYLDENFVNGQILTLNAECFKDIPMRYNAFIDNIEVRLHNGNMYDLTDPAQIFQILLNKNVLVYTDYLSTDEIRKGFLFLLYDGDSKLYRRNYKTYKEGTPSNGIIPEIPSKIVDKPKEYYIKIGNEIPRIFNSKKDLLDIMNSHASEMDDFLKRERTKLNQDDDLIKVLTYFDSL